MRNRTRQRENGRRVSRREALKGLSALAIGGSALAASGCSSDDPTASSGAGGTSPQGQSAAGTGAGPAGTGGSAGATPQQTATAGTSGSAGSTATAGAAPTPPAGTAGAPTAGATSQAGSPAAGGGAGAPATQAGSGGAAGSSMGAAGGAATPSLSSLQCIATPAMTEGPFFVDEIMKRSDLVMGETSDAIVKGVPLKLVIGVYSVSGMACTPLAGAQVDIWHADALGVYSDVAPGAVQSVDTRGKKFLRGYQLTDEQGVVTFDTIYPGWYMSRTIHIHFKLRMLGSGSSAREFTSQMFFDEAINSVVLAKAPYSGHPGMRSVLNDGDHIYNGTATNAQKPRAGTTPPGKSIIPVLVATAAGYTGTLKIGLQM